MLTGTPKLRMVSQGKGWDINAQTHTVMQKSDSKGMSAYPAQTHTYPHAADVGTSLGDVIKSKPCVYNPI